MRKHPIKHYQTLSFLVTTIACKMATKGVRLLQAHDTDATVLSTLEVQFSRENTFRMNTAIQSCLNAP